MMDTEAAVKVGSLALCKLHGDGGCSMHCTYANQRADGGCPKAVNVWGHEARAVVEAVRKSEEGR